MTKQLSETESALAANSVAGGGVDMPATKRLKKIMKRVEPTGPTEVSAAGNNGGIGNMFNNGNKSNPLDNMDYYNGTEQIKKTLQNKPKSLRDIVGK